MKENYWLSVNIAVVRPKAIQGEREKFGRPRKKKLFVRVCVSADGNWRWRDMDGSIVETKTKM
jgi:hypothetical protein